MFAESYARLKRESAMGETENPRSNYVGADIKYSVGAESVI